MTSSRLFEDASNFALRFVADYARLGQMADSLRDLGQTVVLTSGSFDILHEGHSLYLEAARAAGDFLVVGVDSDEKVRARKGPSRPAVPEEERLRMVTHQRGVGLVTLKPAGEERWGLIKAVRPDVLVATAETYTDDEVAALERDFCGRVQVMPRMATVTTSARLRLLQLNAAAGLSQELSARLPELLSQRLAERLPDLLGTLLADHVPGLLKEITEDILASE